jgi:hypothetical protein
MYQLESSHRLTSMIKGLTTKIKYCCLIKASRSPQTTWAILIILSDDLGTTVGSWLVVFEYFVVLDLQTEPCVMDQVTRV